MVSREGQEAPVHQVLQRSLKAFLAEEETTALLIDLVGQFDLYELFGEDLEVDLFCVVSFFLPEEFVAI